MIVNIAAQEECFFLETLLRHERQVVQDHAAFAVDSRHAQAHPFVQHGARANIFGNACDQRIE